MFTLGVHIAKSELKMSLVPRNKGSHGMLKFPGELPLAESFSGCIALLFSQSNLIHNLSQLMICNLNLVVF